MTNFSTHNSKTRWIQVAKVAKQHGITRGEHNFLKCDLEHVGGAAFQKASVYALSETLGSSKKEFSIDVPVKPLGGKWGQAKAAILPIDKNAEWKRGNFVWLKRDEFPLVSDSEFYLCDLYEVLIATSPDGEELAKVVGFIDHSSKSIESISMVLRPLKQGLNFEVPIKAVDWTQSTESKLCVPNLDQWQALV